MNIIKTARLTVKGLLVQLELHSALAKVEWTEEKIRLQNILLIILFGFACFICFLLMTSALFIHLVWHTEYRTAMLIGLSLFYGLAFALSVYRFVNLSAKSTQRFAATKQEIAKDIALIQSQL